MKKPGTAGQTWSPTAQEAQEPEASLGQGPISQTSEKKRVKLHL